MDDEGGGNSVEAPSKRGVEGTACERCGEPIDTSNWHPISKGRDDDGSLQLYAFCSGDCQDAWMDE